MDQPTPKKSSLMRTLEKLHKKPIDQLVREAVASTDTPEAAAAKLGVSDTTLRNWKRDLVEAHLEAVA